MSEIQKDVLELVKILEQYNVQYMSKRIDEGYAEIKIYADYIINVKITEKFYVIDIIQDDKVIQIIHVAGGEYTISIIYKSEKTSLIVNKINVFIVKNILKIVFLK